MSAATPGSVAEPIVNVNAVRDVLKDIPGILRVVHIRTQRGEEAVWIIRDDVDVERDRQIVDAMLDFEGFEFHFATARTQGMVPDGRVIL